MAPVQHEAGAACGPSKAVGGACAQAANLQVASGSKGRCAAEVATSKTVDRQQLLVGRPSPATARDSEALCESILARDRHCKERRGEERRVAVIGGIHRDGDHGEP